MTARCTSLHSGSGGQAPCGRGSCTGSIHPRTLLYNCNKQTVLGKARLSDTGTCRPLYGEQRCIIQTEHSTAGDTGTSRPLYGEQPCIIDSSPSSCTLLCPQSSTDIQHFHTAAPAYITLWYRDIIDLETFQNCLAGSAQLISPMCCFTRQRSTLQCRLLLFPPLSGSLGTYMTTNRHTLIYFITLSDNSERSTSVSLWLADTRHIQQTSCLEHYKFVVN